MLSARCAGTLPRPHAEPGRSYPPTVQVWEEPGGAARNRAGWDAAALIAEHCGAVGFLAAELDARGRDELGIAAGAGGAARICGAAAVLLASRWRPNPAVGRVAGATPR